MAKVYALFLCITRRIGLLCFVVLTQSSIYKEYMDLMDTEALKNTILKIYKLQQIFRPRIISDASTSEKINYMVEK